MEDREEEVYETELSQLFSEEDEVRNNIIYCLPIILFI